MQKTDKDPSLYLDSLQQPQREMMKQLDRLIASVMTDQVRTLWEGTFWGGSEQTIIGYGDLAMGSQKTDWFVIGLALQKNYISLYVNAVKDGQYVAEQYRSKLGKVKGTKASISFKRLEDVDLDQLAVVLQIARDQLTQDRNARGEVGE